MEVDGRRGKEKWTKKLEAFELGEGAESKAALVLLCHSANQPTAQKPPANISNFLPPFDPAATLNTPLSPHITQIHHGTKEEGREATRERLPRPTGPRW